MARLAISASVGVIAAVLATPAQAAEIDRIEFGKSASEAAHHLSGGIPATRGRRLEAPATPGWQGGSMAFRIAVDPEKRTYVTLALSGDEVNPDHLVLLCDGREIGTRLLGDTDAADMGSHAPQYPGRILYNTSPLPRSLTRGRRSLDCRLDSSGPIFPYGQDFAHYQLPMTEPSRAILALYVHDTGYVEPAGGRSPGVAPAPRPRRAPGPEIVDAVRARIDAAVVAMLGTTDVLRQQELQFLARARATAWTAAARDDRVLPRIVDGFDRLFARYRADPDIVGNETSTWNPEWFGFGPMGEVIAHHTGWFGPYLDQEIADPAGGRIRRRAAWSEMMAASRDYHRRNRRFYTNQSQIVDTYGIYLCNRGVAAIDPAHAMPEGQALDYLYQSVGLSPWRGDDLLGGGSAYLAGGPDGTLRGAYSVDGGYRQITQKGLSRELGYVGNYGETLDWIAAMYDATRPTTDQPGDPAILAQLTRMARARGVFRYPTLDADGAPAMRLEAEVGWRDNKYPGEIAYAQRPSWDGSPLQAALATRDPHVIGYAQQMFDDNQYFADLAERLKIPGSRTTAGLLDTPDQYEIFKALPRTPYRLPMTAGQPDFAFDDPENGVVAIKHGEDRLFVSLYWRANHGVNGLAKVHFMTPDADRVATVEEDEVRFSASGTSVARPRTVNPGFNNGKDISYGDLQSAEGGERIPIARPPHGVILRPGDDSPYAGRADFYRLDYAGYTIAMNMSRDTAQTFVSPAGAARDLTTGQSVAARTTITLPPLSTRILLLGR